MDDMKKRACREKRACEGAQCVANITVAEETARLRAAAA